MITRCQSRQQQDENTCPNHLPNSNNLKKNALRKKSPLKSSSKHHGEAKTWPSVKQLRERYETVPNNDDALEGDVKRLRREYSSGGTYRRQSSSSVIRRYREHSVRDDTSYHRNVVDSKKELSLKLRRGNECLETKLPIPSNVIRSGSVQNPTQDADNAAADADDVDDVSALLSTYKTEKVVASVDGTEIRGDENIEPISSPLPTVVNVQQTETSTTTVAHTSSEEYDPDGDAVLVEPVDTSSNCTASDTNAVETEDRSKLELLGENDCVETTLPTSSNTISSASSTLVGDGSLHMSTRETEIDTTDTSTSSDESETDHIIASDDPMKVSCEDTEMKSVVVIEPTLVHFEETIFPPLPAVANNIQTETAATVADTSSVVCGTDEDDTPVELLGTSNNGEINVDNDVDTKDGSDACDTDNAAFNEHDDVPNDTPSMKNESLDEIEPTLAQLNQDCSLASTSFHSNDNANEGERSEKISMAKDSVPKNTVSSFEGRRLKSTQCKADDEGKIDDIEVNEEVVVSRGKTSNIQEEGKDVPDGEENDVFSLNFDKEISENLTVAGLVRKVDDDDMLDSMQRGEIAAPTSSDVCVADKCDALVTCDGLSHEGVKGVSGDERESSMALPNETGLPVQATSYPYCIAREEETDESLLRNLSPKDEELQLVGKADVEDAINDVVEEEKTFTRKEETNLIREVEEEVTEKVNDQRQIKCDQDISSNNLTVAATTFAATENATSTKGARDILICLSQVTVLAITLLGVHYRYALTQTTPAQSHENMATVIRQQVFLIVALLVKVAYKSTCAAVDKDSRIQKAMCFVQNMMFWTATIPLFHENVFAAESICFLPSMISRQMGVDSSPASTCIPNYSLLDVAVKSGYLAVLSILKSTIKVKLINQVWKEIQRALFNPLKFHARVQKVLVILKWAKFFAPLIGTCNKFRGNLLDMAKKRRQHRVSKAALKRWYDAVDALSKQSKSEQAVIKLQKAFRERRVEKSKKRQLLMANRRWVRNKLEEEERLTKSKLEQIERLNMEREQRRQVSSDERRDIVLHKKSARKLMKRLLLNPKTSFSVIWKYLTVSCVALEIMTILLAPVLSGDVKKMPLDQFIMKVLLGSKTECNKSANRRGQITCSASKMEQKWSDVAQVIAQVLVPTVNYICFLDVFITFSTGELSETGTLVPKPFFQRWILPGPVLQLFVNPTMIAIKQAVLNGLGESIKIGPSLCLHCFLASWVLVRYVYEILFDYLLDIIDKIIEFNKLTKGDDGEALHWMQ